jgi:hypothetical protein
LTTMMIPWMDGRICMEWLRYSFFWHILFAKNLFFLFIHSVTYTSFESRLTRAWWIFSLDMATKRLEDVHVSLRREQKREDLFNIYCLLIMWYYCVSEFGRIVRRSRSHGPASQHLFWHVHLTHPLIFLSTSCFTTSTCA